MKPEQDLEDFHTKQGFVIRQKLAEAPAADPNDWLQFLTYNLNGFLKASSSDSIAFAKKYDNRLFRVHLILEEVTELVEALLVRDEVDLADAIADVLYVVFGTALTYDIPIEEIWAEVQTSNMSKAPRTDHRIRDKGASYVPADFKEAIRVGRLQRRTRELQAELDEVKKDA